MIDADRVPHDVGGVVANPYLSGNFGPIHFETTAYDLPVSGEIPRELSGRFLRIGPNPMRQMPNPEQYHWFTGTGLVHALRLQDGKAKWYRSRYVRAGRGPRAIGLESIPGPLGSNDGAVNTNVVQYGDKSYALVRSRRISGRVFVRTRFRREQ